MPMQTQRCREQQQGQLIKGSKKGRNSASKTYKCVKDHGKNQAVPRVNPV